MPLSSPPAASPVVILVMGVAGSGKTVVGRLLAERLGFVFQDADDFHSADNVALMRQGIPLDDEKRGPWLDRLAALVEQAGAARQGLVLACSALKKSYRSRIGVGRPFVRLVHLDGAESLVRERLEQRTGHYMPPSLLASQCALLERPTDDENPIRIDVAPSPESIAGMITAALGRG